MKAKHIKKLRKKIKHYYIAMYDDWMFGFKQPCTPSDIKNRGDIAYGLNESDAIKRYTHTSCGYCESNWMFAKWAMIPVDKVNSKFITYWRDR